MEQSLNKLFNLNKGKYPVKDNEKYIRKFLYGDDLESPLTHCKIRRACTRS